MSAIQITGKSLFKFLNFLKFSPTPHIPTLSLRFICLLRCTRTCDMLCPQCAAQREFWPFTAACLQHWWQCFLTLGCSSSPTMSLKKCWLRRPKPEIQEVSGDQTRCWHLLRHITFITPHYAHTHTHSLKCCWLFMSPFKETWEAWSVAVELESSAKQSHTPLTSSRRGCRWGALRQPELTLDR